MDFLIPGLRHFLVLGSILFSLGMYGVLSRRNAIGILLGIELMLNGVNLLMVAFSRYIVTTQELALIEEADKTKLILDSIDAWLLSQSSLINKRTRAVLPRCVTDRRWCRRRGVCWAIRGSGGAPRASRR